jgi:hypothetical protein
MKNNINERLVVDMSALASSRPGAGGRRKLHYGLNRLSSRVESGILNSTSKENIEDQPMTD